MTLLNSRCYTSCYTLSGYPVYAKCRSRKLFLFIILRKLWASPHALCILLLNDIDL